MFNILFNVALALLATAYTASFWDDPDAQFSCGMGVVLIVWCTLDALTAVMKL